MKKTKIIALTCCIGLLSACSNITGGGVVGRFVNDVVPENGTIYSPSIDSAGTTEHTPGTEGDTNTDLVWNSYTGPVPCSDIKLVEYWLGGVDDGEIGLPLTGEKYGGKYYPPHPKGEGYHWTRPNLWIDTDKESGETKGDFTKEQAEAIAIHCGVEFQVRS